MKRRQLLVLGSAIASLGMTQCVNQRVISTAPASARSKHLPIGPQGLFAPVRGDVRIVVISDLNSQYGSTTYEPEVQQAISLIPAWQPDLVLCSGDMIAAQSKSLSDAQIQAMWAGFNQTIGAPLRKANLPLGFTLGNHDGSGALGSGGERLFERDRTLADRYWNQPSHRPKLPFVDRAQFPFYYTFAQNEIFYLVWDASTAILSSQQLAWVEKSLASNTAQNARLRIVIGHLPLYAVAVGRDKAGEFLDRADDLRSLLEKYHVHTYISGHDHAYFPGHRGQLQLLQTGALGTGPRRWLNSSLSPCKTLTIVDITLNEAKTVYTTYNMTTQQVLDYRMLPRQVVAPNGPVFRRDVPQSV
jgi:hypothetical protein